MFRRYVGPYKKYVASSLAFNVLSALLNVFSFASLIPMLKLLFNTEQTVYHFMPWDAEGKALSDIAINNAYYYTSQLVANYGAAPTLLMIGVLL